MARPREFDETAVLEAAVQCFWSRGYEATSVRDLAEKMGITGASLYNAFGDKRSLYRCALAYYVRESFGDRVGRFEGNMPPRQAITAFFEEIIERSLDDPQRKGCMLVNSALENGAARSRVSTRRRRCHGTGRGFFSALCHGRTERRDDLGISFGGRFGPSPLEYASGASCPRAHPARTRTARGGVAARARTAPHPNLPEGAQREMIAPGCSRSFSRLPPRLRRLNDERTFD